MSLSNLICKISKIQNNTDRIIQDLKVEWIQNKHIINEDINYINSLIQTESNTLNTFKLKSITLTKSNEKISNYPVTLTELYNFKQILIKYLDQLEELYKNKINFYSDQLALFNKELENNQSLKPLLEMSKILRKMC